MIFKFRYLPKGSLVVKPIVNENEDKLIEIEALSTSFKYVEVEVEAPTFIEAERLFNLSIKRGMFRKVDEIYGSI